jgi:hypothetical protein
MHKNVDLTINFKRLKWQVLFYVHFIKILKIRLSRREEGVTTKQ